MLDGLISFLRHDTTSGLQLNELDSFRGWAVIGVMMAHIKSHSPESSYSVYMNWVFSDSVSGLDLFFFISGFLLFMSWGKAYYEGRPPISLRSFYLRRVKRIAPLYYFQLLVLAIFAGTYLFEGLGNKGPLDLIAHFLFIHNLWPEITNSYNGPMWTLAVEAQFYIVLPFMASWFYGRRGFVAVAAIIIFSIGYRLWITSLVTENLGAMFMKEMAVSLLPGRLSQFAIGMFFANLWLLTKYRKDSYGFLADRRVATAMLAVGLAGCFWLFHIRIPKLYYLGNGPLALLSVWSSIFAFSCGVLILGTLNSSLFKGFLANRCIELIGIISYSIYLWHFPVLNFVKHRLADMDLQPDERFIFFAAGTVVMTLAVSFLSYIMLERPFLKVRRAKAARGAGPALAEAK